MSEYIDLYDKYRNSLNKTFLRAAKDNSKIPENEFGLVVSVLIFNSNNELLIQKRAATKNKHANLWDVSCSGHALSGEDSYACVERELEEELGIRYDFTDERPYLTIHGKHFFRDVFIINLDVDLNDLKLQYSEVSNVAWVDYEEIKQLIKEEKFVPYYSGYLELLFEMRKNRGVKREKEKIN